MKYLLAYSVPLIGILGIYFQGIWSYTLVMYVFVLIPILEHFLPIDASNYSEEELKNRLKNKLYNALLYLNIPIVYGCLYYTFSVVKSEQLSYFELIGIILSLGIILGSNGINVAHELGHRKKLFERIFGKLLLIPSHYTHFFIEHNKGHHAHVATDQDPSSAILGQSIYSFWPQTVFGTYFKAWEINLAELKKKGLGFFSFQNEMLLFTCAHLILIGIIGINLGLNAICLFLVSASIGALLLETVNYIEHYGLVRKRNPSGNFERVLPKHSWNSNHLLGRLMLFELSRHSDHHYLASRKYQILRHHDDAPQMPTGYPGMIVLALFPPIWFRVMNRQLKKYESIISA